MSFVLPLAYYKEWREDEERRAAAKAASGLADPLLEPADGGAAALDGDAPAGVKKGSLRETLLLSLPSFFDLVATVLMNVGLMSVTASVYQMMRGAEMLFAALFAVVFLRRRLNKFHYGGIGCCAAGIALVGMSSIFGGEGSSTHVVSTEQMLAGMGLIVLSQAVQAAQLTFEDFFMADLAMDPMKIVGFEGVFGTVWKGGVGF
jgi:drug/metabolite transporter (DMT)-like permease